MATNKEKAVAGAEDSEIKFSKSQIVKSKRYAVRRDALNALLKDDKKYSFSEVEKILDKFDKGGKK
ncbi:hypothetical protein V7122_02520 [Bacillus sp. JJ1532]|uniref:hypothetical protein n=1 Tax=unclassified Bacillus (in: firmicutes) TaxID=185979 RepID=UPI002FFED68E